MLFGDNVIDWKAEAVCRLRQLTVLTTEIGSLANTEVERGIHEPLTCRHEHI